MKLEELKQAIAVTLAEIERINEDIQQAGDAAEKRQLIRRKKELQYLQLWHLEQMEFLKDTWG